MRELFSPLSFIPFLSHFTFRWPLSFLTFYLSGHSWSQLVARFQDTYVLTTWLLLVTSGHFKGLIYVTLWHHSFLSQSSANLPHSPPSHIALRRKVGMYGADERQGGGRRARAVERAHERWAREWPCEKLDKDRYKRGFGGDDGRKTFLVQSIPVRMICR